VTGIENKIYPTEIYNTFTPAQKAKHWQLKRPDQIPGTGPAKSTRGDATGMTSQLAEFKTAMSTAASAISDFTAATKRAADDEESELTKDSGWGRNRDSPALGRQDSVPKKSKN
jgi:hypothetical protein